MQDNKEKTNNISRPPVVVIMGHVDHGKSTLLDYIRKTNVVEGEVGGITQKISAYEVVHKDEHGKDRKITFLDTPGHESFSKMRERGVEIADIAILVVSAEDGVKPQTIEAWKTITESKLPVIVAINKIDKPGANVEKTKIELAEHEIYLENYGGKLPFVEISAKAGTGVDSLLSLILLIRDMEDFKGDSAAHASGFVIEVHLDPKRGIWATLIVKEGSLVKGMTVVVEESMCSTRIMENFKGEIISEATFSSPVRIVGFDTMPKVGARFASFTSKEEAEAYVRDFKNKKQKTSPDQSRDPDSDRDKKIIPIVLKADVAGSLEAIEKEIEKIKNDTAVFKIVAKGVGPISESDIKNVSTESGALVIGFNVKADKSAIEVAEKRGVTISFFNIIYKVIEWLGEEMEKRRPRVETFAVVGRAKIIRAFSRTKERQIVGGKVTEGQLLLNGTVKIIRREFEIGRGKIVNLEKSKVKINEISEGSEFGMMVESKIEIVAGDTIELFSIEHK